MSHVRAWPVTWLLAAALVAFWPVWDWYARRLDDGGGEPWGLFALIVAVSIVALRGTPGVVVPRSLIGPGLLAAVYIVGYGSLPPLLRGVVAFSVLAMLVSATRAERSPDIGVWGLFMLALPVVSTFQFLFAFPLRVAVGEIAAPLLQLAGLNVRAEGAVLLWGATQVVIDAPCSGIKMLWAGALLSFSMIALTNMKPGASIRLLVATIIIVILVNVLRVSALFYTETGIVDAPAFTHAAIGIVCFSIGSAGLLALAYRLDGHPS